MRNLLLTSAIILAGLSGYSRGMHRTGAGAPDPEGRGLIE